MSNILFTLSINQPTWLVCVFSVYISSEYPPSYLYPAYRYYLYCIELPAGLASYKTAGKILYYIWACCHFWFMQLVWLFLLFLWLRLDQLIAVEVGGVFKEYELDKVQPLTRPNSVDSSNESVSRKVEKVSQNVDMDTMPVCFGDFKKCTVNFRFKWLELVSL